MLNIEKYKQQLIELKVLNIGELAKITNKLTSCKCTNCSICDFDAGDCMPEAIDWLFSEYKEPQIDWSKVKVNTPILVRNKEGGEWMNRYFAKFEDGKFYAWVGGATSWTVDDEYDVTSWKYAKLAEREE